MQNKCPTNNLTIGTLVTGLIVGFLLLVFDLLHEWKALVFSGCVLVFIALFLFIGAVFLLLMQ